MTEEEKKLVWIKTNVRELHLGVKADLREAKEQMKMLRTKIAVLEELEVRTLMLADGTDEILGK